MIKNIFLDRDGIINEVVMRGAVVSSPRTMEEFKIRGDFEQFSLKLKQYSANLFVVSNQPDVSRSLIDVSLLDKIDQKIKSLIAVKEIRYCVHDNKDNCTCRKPQPGMINSLLTEYDLKAEESCIIGDSFKDIEAGRLAGITTFFLETDYSGNQLVKPDYKITSLNDLFQCNLFTLVA